MVPPAITRIPASDRATFVERLSDILLAPDREVPHAAEGWGVLSMLAASLEGTARRAAARRLARSDAVPRTLITTFARDPIEVATPILRWSPVFDADLLDEIVRDISDNHLLEISRRDSLSAAMAAILYAHGSQGVRLNIARNPGAELNGKLLMAMMRQAIRDRILEEALCGRDDLPESAAESLMRRVRRRLKSEVGSAASALDTGELRLALRTNGVETGSDVCDMQGLSLDAFVTITRLDRAGELSEKNLIDYAKRANTGATLLCFAKLVGLHPTIVRHFFFLEESESLLVAARAHPLGREAFAEIVAFREKMVTADRTADALIEEFDCLPVDRARRVMSFHRMRRAARAGVRNDNSAQSHEALAPAGAG